MNKECSVRGIQLLWRETDRQESTEGTADGFHFVQFKMFVEETLSIMTLVDRLSEANKFSMVLTYVLSLIGAMKSIKIVLQLLIDKSIVVVSSMRNVHLPKDVKKRIEILDEHLISKHESTLRDVHHHFKKIGVHVGGRDSIAAADVNNDGSGESDNVSVEMVSLSNPLAVASDRKRFSVLEEQLREQAREIQELKGMVLAMQQ